MKYTPENFDETEAEVLALDALRESCKVRVRAAMSATYPSDLPSDLIADFILAYGKRWPAILKEAERLALGLVRFDRDPG